MAVKSFLPDTNVLSALFRRDQQVVDLLRKAQKIWICPVVEAELISGFRLGSKATENLKAWSSFLAEPFVEQGLLGSETSDRYSRIWLHLRRRGTPIPTNDIWIAASAGEFSAELISFDAHFEMIDGLVWRHLKMSVD